MKIKSSHSKTAALFEKRHVIQKLIDRAQAKKMNLNRQKTHFYRLQAVLEATIHRLYNDLKRLETLQRKQLYATTTELSSHCKSLKKDFPFLGSSLGSSLSSSENDVKTLDFNQKLKDAMVTHWPSMLFFNV